jgi:hypothetical protein
VIARVTPKDTKQVSKHFPFYIAEDGGDFEDKLQAAYKLAEQYASDLLR